MHKFCFFFLGILIWISANSQKMDTVYLSANDSSANRYIVVYPPKLPAGLLFLIPGMFQKPEDVIRQTDLPKIAARQGILTIIPTFSTGISSFGIDTTTQASLLSLLDHVMSRYQLTNQPFYIGGFSIGGTCAVKYGELAYSNNYPVKPAAIFAIDAPLDFERMYNTSIREMRLAGTDMDLIAENQYMLKRYALEFGGPPSSHLSFYHKGSPYSFSDTSYMAIRSLLNVPIRLYTEPDIQWSLMAGIDYSGMNAFDLAAMTNDLKKLGSQKISLVTTSNKGYRKPDNRRHPHSWSIAEPNELVKWLLSQK